MPSLEIVFDYRETAKFAFNALAGALETDGETAAVPVAFVGRRASLAGALEAALGRAERVLCCWSFFSPGFPAAAARLAAVRAAAPDPRVLHVAGGVQATAEPVETLRGGFDLAAVGEGERIIVDLVRAILAGADPREVEGIASLDPATGLLRLRGRGEAVDLDRWPPFAPAHGRIGPIELTRGCIYACRFCQTPFMNRARFRHRSIDEVRRWVRVQKERGFRDYRFITPTSLSYGTAGEEPALDRVEALLAAVRAIVGPEGRVYYGTFPSEVRPEHVSREALEILRRHVTNRSLIIGAQSGSEAVLAEARRGHGVEVVERAVALAVEAGFEPHVDLIFGLPGEGPADVEATLRLAEALAARGARIHGHTFMPLPGTPFRDAAPGAIAPEARRRLESLIGTRKLYGEWARQAEVARALAARRAGVRRLPMI
jgi:B12-binding domain/radical SAM domain protein